MSETPSPIAYPLAQPPQLRPAMPAGRTLLDAFNEVGSDDELEDYGPGYETPEIDEGPDNDTPAAMAERWDIEAAETAANALKAHGCSY